MFSPDVYRTFVVRIAQLVMFSEVNISSEVAFNNSHVSDNFNKNEPESSFGHLFPACTGVSVLMVCHPRGGGDPEYST
jgi:hypothetical protein